MSASPSAALRRQRDSLREMRGRLAAALRRQLLVQKSQVQSLRGDLVQLSPAVAVQRSLGALLALRQRLATSTLGLLAGSKHRTALLGRALHSVSPLATLDRGYAIVSDVGTGKVLLRASDVQSGAAIRARLAHGELLATVTQVIDDD